MMKGSILPLYNKLYKDKDGSLARLNRQLHLLHIEHEKKLCKLKKTYSDNTHSFFDLCSKLDENRDRDDLKFGNEIENIEKEVTDLTSVFKDRKLLENSDEKHLCNRVVRTSRNIFSTKDSLHSQLKQLQSEENKIIQDLNAKYKELDEFAKQQGPRNSRILLKHKIKPTTKLKSVDSCAEVNDFQNFLDETGGHYGGWREEDHLLFLKVNNKHKLDKTAEIIHQQLPDIKLEDVLDHEEWFRKYIALREKKKKAIAEWKEKQKERNCKASTNIEKKSKPITIKRDPQEKLKLERWKAEQQLKVNQEEEELRIKEMIKHKEEEKWRKMVERQRNIVNNYKKEKNESEQALAAAQKEQEILEAYQKATEANKMLRQFRQEDRKYTDRIKARRASVKSEEEVSVKSSVQAERDPERLLRPTQVWLHRTKKNNDEEEELAVPPPQPLYILKVPHLGKPAWRKGLST